MKIISQYRQYIPLVFFIFGFALDVLTLGRIDDIWNIIQQGIYLFLGLFLLLLRHLDISKWVSKYKFFEKIIFYEKEIFHFALGSLLSAFTIFFFKSSSSWQSYFFLVFILALLIFNETQHLQEKGLDIKYALLSLCFVCYLTYVLPIIFSFFAQIFLYLAVVFTLAIFYVVNLKLKNIKMGESALILIPLKPIYLTMGLIILLNLVHAIPPVPLSVNFMGIYHNVEKVDGNYRLSYTRPFYKFWQKGDQEFLARNGDKVYFFTSIFSPGGFNEKIYVHWQQKNPKGEWQTSDRIPIEIVGGREQGFRGFTFKENFTAGDWKINLETQSGRAIGHIGFEIEKDLSSGPRKYKYQLK